MVLVSSLQTTLAFRQTPSRRWRSVRDIRVNPKRPRFIVCVDPRSSQKSGRSVANPGLLYVADGDVALRSIPKKVGEIRKLSIPSLPDELDGRCGAQTSSGFWEWKPKLLVHYEKSEPEDSGAPPVLFLPGFGVGTFHFEKQLEDLGRDYRVWVVDFLGQGMSLPSEDPAPHDEEGVGGMELWGFGQKPQAWAEELAYSVDLWRDQVQHFVEEVIREPVYLVGNSLGGFVALYFAARFPHLVKGVTLLNATPFWGFFPNRVKSPRIAKLFPWTGTFPLPSIVRRITKFLWLKISDPETIRQILKQVYADHSTNVDRVFTRIIETTQHPAAAASFASIMCSPMAEISFQEALSSCQIQGVPICLMYGKEDPWVRPIWGRTVKLQLPEVPYYEISPAGHCPHDEVPEVINFLLRGWIKSLESDGSSTLPFVTEPFDAEHGITRELEYMRGGSQRSVQVQLLGLKYSPWSEITALAKSQLVRLQSLFR